MSLSDLWEQNVHWNAEILDTWAWCGRGCNINARKRKHVECVLEETCIINETLF